MDKQESRVGTSKCRGCTHCGSVGSARALAMGRGMNTGQPTKPPTGTHSRRSQRPFTGSLRWSMHPAGQREGSLEGTVAPCGRCCIVWLPHKQVSSNGTKRPARSTSARCPPHRHRWCSWHTSRSLASGTRICSLRSSCAGVRAGQYAAFRCMRLLARRLQRGGRMRGQMRQRRSPFAAQPLALRGAMPVLQVSALRFL